MSQLGLRASGSAMPSLSTSVSVGKKLGVEMGIIQTKVDHSNWMHCTLLGGAPPFDLGHYQTWILYTHLPGQALHENLHPRNRARCHGSRGSWLRRKRKTQGPELQ